MPIIRVEMWEGRTKAQKQDLAASLTREMCRVSGCPPEQLYIVFEDVPKENWAIGGELSADAYPD